MLQRLVARCLYRRRLPCNCESSTACLRTGRLLCRTGACRLVSRSMAATASSVWSNQFRALQVLLVELTCAYCLSSPRFHGVGVGITNFGTEIATRSSLAPRNVQRTVNMNRCLTSALFASALMFGATAANAAPMSATPVAPEAVRGVELVHGEHRSCRSGHRHSRSGDRVRCGAGVTVYRTEPSVSIRVGKDRDRRDGRRGDGDRRDRR